MLLMSPLQGFAYLWVFFHKASPYAVDVALSGLGMFMCFFIRIHLMFLMSPFQGFAYLWVFSHKALPYAVDVALSGLCLFVGVFT